MDRHPRLQVWLGKLHIPKYLFVAFQPAEKSRRVSQQERLAAAAFQSGRLAAIHELNGSPATDTTPTNISAPEVNTTASEGTKFTSSEGEN